MIIREVKNEERQKNPHGVDVRVGDETLTLYADSLAESPKNIVICS